MKHLLLLLATGLLLVTSVAYTQLPQTLSYQGLLTGSSGNPIPDGNYDLTFILYTIPSGGTSIWAETHSGVPVARGTFSVILGSITPFTGVAFDQQLYLGFAVDANPEMSPRSALGSAPSALVANAVSGSGNVVTSGVVDATGAASKIRFFYNTTAELPDAITYHGAIAHVHADGKLYFAHAGLWVPLSAEGHTHSSLAASDGSPDPALSVDADGNIGIGTPSPSRPLDVVGSVKVSDTLFASNVSSNSPLRLQTNDSTRIYIDDAGKVGIGTASPTEMLHVAGVVYSSSGGIRFPDGTIQATASGVGPFLPLAGGTMTGAIANTGDPSITMGKGNFGTGNINTGTQAFVAGSNNRARGNYSTVAGGGSAGVADSNAALGDYSTVSGGRRARASGQSSTVGGGEQNNASRSYATIAGGYQNTASNDGATVGGGYLNNAAGLYATVNGGSSNVATGTFANIGGGAANTASGLVSAIGGGGDHIASGSNATISGGSMNIASNAYTAVGGGRFNRARGQFSVVGGGGGSTAPDSNSALGDWSAIPGGRGNVASGMYSFAAGRRAKANHSGTFIWGDQTDADFASTTANQFLIRASGGVGIGTTSPQGALDVNSTTGAFIVPRMTTTERDALTPVNGMIIYNTTTNQFNFYENGAWVTK